MTLLDTNVLGVVFCCFANKSPLRGNGDSVCGSVLFVPGLEEEVQEDDRIVLLSSPYTPLSVRRALPCLFFVGARNDRMRCSRKFVTIKWRGGRWCVCCV